VDHLLFDRGRFNFAERARAEELQLLPPAKPKCKNAFPEEEHALKQIFKNPCNQEAFTACEYFRQEQRPQSP
jgi:hypothetical protein